ncbi:MAG: hypothetical protein ABIO67_02810 [Mycobacteriales bacterium]
MDAPLNDQALTDLALTSELLTWAGRAAAAEARLVALIGEFDAREAWAGVGVLSCAHWLSWQLGMGLVAARERVRAPRALRLLPVTQEAFAAGRFSRLLARPRAGCDLYGRHNDRRHGYTLTRDDRGADRLRRNGTDRRRHANQRHSSECAGGGGDAETKPARAGTNFHVGVSPGVDPRHADAE